MAKVSFTKLGLSKNQEVKILEWNGQNVEIKQYISINDRLDLIANVANKSHDENNFANPVKLKVCTVLEILYYYTNINFTEKQKEDIVKTYDLVISSGFVNSVFSLIPPDELNSIFTDVRECVESIYAYNNSIVGILDTLKTDYSTLNFDATAIQQKLADPENMAFLKEVLDKLG